jgi:ubiquinone/menaquinone biosynthesis C-methylase UbiE
LARAAGERAQISIEVTDGTAETLPGEEGESDAAVASLVLCSVRDQNAALREIFRVLWREGELRFYEHVISRHQATARVQRALDATTYPALARRRPLRARHRHRDRHAGFEIDYEQQIAFKLANVMTIHQSK